MIDPNSSNSAAWRQDFKVYLIMMAVILVPTALTLQSVHQPGPMIYACDPPPGNMVDPVASGTGWQSGLVSSNPTPLGYTWSQLIFLIPSLVMGFWFMHKSKDEWEPGEHKIAVRSFWKSVLIFFFAGMLLLDIPLGNTFFCFPNPASNMGIHLPGLDYTGGTHLVYDIPIEELAFYGFGGVFMLLFYIWSDRFWLGAYRLNASEEAKKIEQIARPHWKSVIWSFVIFGAALAYKKLISDVPEGFPGYLCLMIFSFFSLMFVLYRELGPFINWRAMSLTTAAMWMMSLIWEGTLGVKYGWWQYNQDQMTGLFLGAWYDLPIEEPILWTIAALGIVFFYEYFRIHQHMGRSHRETLFGIAKVEEVMQ